MTSDRVARAALSAFGLGFSPLAPGTAGSLATAALVWGAHALVGPGAALVLAVALLAAGAAVTLAWSARFERDGKDPSWVVSDEVAGQAIAAGAAVLVAGRLAPWAGMLAAFVLFRVLDIAKPWPVGRLERVPAAGGILLDDLAAGAIAAVLVAALALVLPAM